MSEAALDLSDVQPEARPILEQAARVYIAHTRPWFEGLLAHGSAVKGGFIPGCSDIDLKLYLRDELFEGCSHLPLELSVAIHRELATIDPAPFSYIQCDAVPVGKPTSGEIGPVRGAYHLLAGRLPVPEATEGEIRESARKGLSELDPTSPPTVRALLDRGEGRLERHVRLLCTNVWPALSQVLVLQEPDPVRVWGLTKQQAIARLPADTPMGREIRRFHSALLAYYPTEASVESAFEVIESGIAFYQAVVEWWGTNCSR
jgi:hypothetical protein